MKEIADPFNLREWFKASTIQKLEAWPEYDLALRIHQSIVDGYHFCLEKPRWAVWWDQANRSSMSVGHNISEAAGKARGYFVSAYLIARAEAYECYFSLQVGPKEICEPLRPLQKQLIEEMNETLAACPLDRLESMNQQLMRS